VTPRPASGSPAPTLATGSNVRDPPGDIGCGVLGRLARGPIPRSDTGRDRGAGIESDEGGNDVALLAGTGVVTGTGDVGTASALGKGDVGPLLSWRMSLLPECASPSCQAHSLTRSSTFPAPASDKAFLTLSRPFQASLAPSAASELKGGRAEIYPDMALPIPSIASLNSAICRSWSLNLAWRRATSPCGWGDGAANVEEGEDEDNGRGMYVLRLGRAETDGMDENEPSRAGGERGEKGRFGRYEYADAVSGRLRYRC
jgi:hypothetical protein